MTGAGIARNLRRHYPRPLLVPMVGLLLIANIVNLGADLAGMGAAVGLLIGSPLWLYTVLFGAFCVILEVWMSYERYASVLKWATLSLFAYVAVVIVARVPWGEALTSLVVPRIEYTGAYATAAVAILSTTISPYLFFWQASQEIEEQKRHQAKPLCITPKDAGPELKRIRIDTLTGMAFSSIVSRWQSSLLPPRRCMPMACVTLNIGAGSGSIAPNCRKFCLCAVRSWCYRNWPACCASVSQISGLCGDRNVWNRL